LFSDFNEEADDFNLTISEKLVNSQKNYQHLFNTSPFSIVIIDSNGDIVDVNPTTEILFGYKKKELIGKSALKIINFPPKTFNFVKKNLNLLLEGIEVQPIEIQISLKNGTKKWILSNMSFFEFNGANFFQAIIQDITLRKEAELRLKESENKFRNIFETIPDVYFLVSRDMTIIEYQGNVDYLYVRPESLIGRKITEIIPSDIAKQSLKAVKTTFKTKKLQMFEFNLEWKGKTYNFEARHLYLSENLVSIFVRDITERKYAQEKLKESEQKYRNIIERNYDGYYEVNLKGDFTFVNKRICEFLNYTKKELIGSNFRKYILEKDREQVENKFTKLYEMKLPQIIVEYSAVIKGGDERLVEVTGYIKKDVDGNIIGFYGLSRDINIHKKLKESEEKYRNLFNTAPFGIVLFGLDGKIKDINNRFLEIIGYTRDDLINKSYKQTEIYPDIGSFDENVIKKIIHGGELSKPKEVPIFRKDGEKIWVYYQLSMVKFGEKRYIQALFNDVTERKKAEEDLKISEANYRIAYDRANFYKNLFAHDMNNILQVISSSVELLSIYKDDPTNKKERDNLIKYIEDSAIRGANLVMNVQKLSYLEELDTNIHDINICNLLKEAINFTKNKYKKKNDFS